MTSHSHRPHKPTSSSSGAPSGASGKKRKSREMQLDPLLDQEDSEYATLRSTLLRTHSLLTSVDPLELRKFLLGKLDEALLMSLPSNRRRLSLAGDSLPSRGSREGSDQHRRTSSLSSASFQPGPSGPSNAASSSTAATTNITGSTGISITTSDPTLSQSSILPSSSSFWSSTSLSSSTLNPIRAFSLIFEDFESFLASTRSNHQYHLSSSSASNSSPSWSPSTSRSTASSSHRHTGSTTDKAQQMEESESHCARCHLDYQPSRNTSRSCIIEHNQESCIRVSKNGQASSVWKYECCNYKFTSPYCDEPEDPNEDTDKGSFCFVGRHTTDEKLAAAKKMNTYPCDEIGCWEDDEDEIEEDERIPKDGQPDESKATADDTAS